jgi:hypothetical protein
MKKIQIDIRRSLPAGRAKAGQTVDRCGAVQQSSQQWCARGLGDPLLLLVPRRAGEGRRGLLDREEIREGGRREEEVLYRYCHLGSLISTN